MLQKQGEELVEFSKPHLLVSLRPVNAEGNDPKPGRLPPKSCRVTVHTARSHRERLSQYYNRTMGDALAGRLNIGHFNRKVNWQVRMTLTLSDVVFAAVHPQNTACKPVGIGDAEGPDGCCHILGTGHATHGVLRAGLLGHLVEPGNCPR